jgi:glucose-6-phosphate 1-epimerase
MSAQATCRDTTFAGLPACELALPSGDRLVVALHGAHVLSWVSDGQERLYLSPQSILDGQAAIRGGVPVCFPQFNQRGPMAERLPKHGFARNVAWWVDAPELGAEHARLTLRVHNTDTQALAFSGALHTYLAVPDVSQATLQGLGGQPEWDSLTDTHAPAADTIRFAAEFDRVYEASANPMTLNQTLQISQSPSWANTVVWNPAQDLCKRLADMPDDGWRQMLCVEAAQVYAPITLPAGGRWAGWQRLQVLKP